MAESHEMSSVTLRVAKASACGAACVHGQPQTQLQDRQKPDARPMPSHRTARRSGAAPAGAHASAHSSPRSAAGEARGPTSHSRTLAASLRECRRGQLAVLAGDQPPAAGWLQEDNRGSMSLAARSTGSYIGSAEAKLYQHRTGLATPRAKAWANARLQGTRCLTGQLQAKCTYGCLKCAELTECCLLLGAAHGPQNLLAPCRKHARLPEGLKTGSWRGLLHRSSSALPQQGAW